MAGSKQNIEEKLLGKLRATGGILLIVVGVFMAIAPIFNIELFRSDYKPDPFVLGTIIGAGLLLLGVETIGRLPGISMTKKSDDQEEREK